MNHRPCGPSLQCEAMAELIYHYTKAASLHEILASSTPEAIAAGGESGRAADFWAREARQFPQDENELFFGLPHVIGALRNFNGDLGDKGRLTYDDYRTVADLLEDGHLAPTDEYGVHVASFSRTPNDDYMWHEHQSDYCLEIRAEDCLGVPGTQRTTRGFTWIRGGAGRPFGATQYLLGFNVTYGDSPSAIRAREMLAEFPTDDNRPSESEDAQVSLWRLHIHAIRILTTLKMHCYARENEFRLTSTIAHRDNVFQHNGSGYAHFYVPGIDAGLISITAATSDGVELARDVIQSYPTAKRIQIQVRSDVRD